MLYLTEYLIGLLTVASLLMAWFQSGLPNHVLDLLGWFNRSCKEARSAALLLTDGKLSLLEAMNIVVAGEVPVIRLLVELVSCRACLSFHVSFWTSLIVWAMTDTPVVFIPAATLSWPYLANFLLTKLTHHDH